MSKCVSEITIVTFNKTLLREICVLTGDDVAHQIVTECVDTVFVCKHKWINNVPCAFAHLRAAEVQPAVNQQLRHLVIWKTDRVQHDEPVNAVRRDENVFADDLKRRPFVAES